MSRPEISTDTSTVYIPPEVPLRVFAAAGPGTGTPFLDQV